MTMNNINIVEKKDDENDKHIFRFFLRNKIYLDNIKVENSLYYEEFLSTFLKENNYNSYQLEFFNQRVNAKLLFETVYEFFKQLDDELFSNFFSLFINKDKNIIFAANNPIKDFVGITYLNNDNIKIKMTRSKTIEDIFTLVHEYGHALNMKKNPKLYNNEARTHFEEIESIFLELILCDYLVNNGFNKDDINEVKKIIIENLINEAKELYFKYNINRFIHVEQIKNIDNHFFKLLYQKKNITKDELRKVYSSSYEDVTKYVISSLFALELYDKYQINKEKTIEDYKNIISLDLYTHLDYLDAIESKLIVPNESDTFIRTLKK